MIIVHLKDGEKVEVSNVKIEQLCKVLNDQNKIGHSQFLTINNKHVFIWDNVLYIEGAKNENN